MLWWKQTPFLVFIRKKNVSKNNIVLVWVEATVNPLTPLQIYCCKNCQMCVLISLCYRERGTSLWIPSQSKWDYFYRKFSEAVLSHLLFVAIILDRDVGNGCSHQIVKLTTSLVTRSKRSICEVSVLLTSSSHQTSPGSLADDRSFVVCLHLI